MRTTPKQLQATYTFAVDRAQAAGLDTTGWILHTGSKTYGYRYEIVNRNGMRIDLGVTSGAAHVTLTAVAAAWHAVAVANAARVER